MQSEELKPCGVCGGKPKLRAKSFDEYYCPSCEARRLTEFREMELKFARQRWNDKQDEVTRAEGKEGA